MKKTKWILATFVVVFTFFGCSNDKGDGLWLTDLSNPFIGQWQSNIPSMGNAKAVFEFKTDGNFTCVFPDLPLDQGGGVIYTGGYLVKDNVQVTFLSGDGGIGGYTFEVVDNNTINVTEIDEVNETSGEYTYGNTTSFARVSNSPINKNNKPFALNNALIGGIWKETTTPYQAEYSYKTDGTGTMSYTGGGTSAIAYSMFYDEGIDKDVLVMYMMATKTFTSYTLEQTENTISVREIIDVTIGAMGPSANYSTAVTFTRSQ